jgi:hypothetical protein
MADKTHYIIRGGVEGRERLRVLARVMRPATVSLLHRAGIRPGMACLDVGLASRAEIDGIVADLYAFARAAGTVGSGARVVEAWGRRPAA